MSKRPTLDPLMLAQFTGSQNFYRHSLVREVLYTEGVEYVAETAGAYWLLDEIALAQRYIISVKREDFQVWDLKVDTAQAGVLTCGDGNGLEVYVKLFEQSMKGGAMTFGSASIIEATIFWLSRPLSHARYTQLMRPNT